MTSIIQIKKTINKSFKYFKGYNQHDLEVMVSSLINDGDVDLTTKVMLTKNILHYIKTSDLNKIKSYIKFEEACIEYLQLSTDDLMCNDVLLTLNKKIDINLVSKYKCNTFLSLCVGFDYIEDIETKLIELLNEKGNEIHTDILNEIINKYPKLLFTKSNKDEYFLFELNNYNITNYSDFFIYYKDVLSKNNDNVLMKYPFNDNKILFDYLIACYPKYIIDINNNNESIFTLINNKDLLYSLFIEKFQTISEFLLKMLLKQSLLSLMDEKMMGDLFSISTDFDNFIRDNYFLI